MKSSVVRFWIVFIVILGAGTLVNTWALLGEAHVERKPLKEFPTQVGAWQQVGADSVLDAATLQVLRANDYLLRDFRRSDGTPANFYVGYYVTQSNGASYHSPLNCLPGAGWVLSEPGHVELPGPSGTFTANKYVIQNGNYKSLMIYWYQGRGRAVASEYWGKVYTVIDSVKLRRSDGAMVRVTVPIVDSEDKALASATDLATAVSTTLPEYIPN